MNAQVSLGGLSDAELVSRLESLCKVERRVGAAIVAHLCEVERRRLHLDAGYSSLYTYCVERLGLSEEVAYKRMQAARAAARHPEVLEHLEAGDLSLSSLVVLAPHLDEHGDLLDAALGKSMREVKRLLAEQLDAHMRIQLLNQPSSKRWLGAGCDLKSFSAERPLVGSRRPSIWTAILIPPAMWQGFSIER